MQLQTRDSKLMGTKISHSGVIEEIQGSNVKVRIVQTSACAACKVAGYCNAAEKKEKIIDVQNVDATSYTLGQTVTVSTSGQVAARALLWAFGLPFVVLIVVLISVLWFTKDEGLAAISALLALVPYYLIIWTQRNKLREQLSFTIE